MELDSKVLRIIFGDKGDKITEEWRKMFEESHNLYLVLHTVNVIRSRNVRLEEQTNT
jgi:hypothetical protein